MELFCTLKDGRKVYHQTVNNVDHFYVRGGNAYDIRTFLLNELNEIIRKEILNVHSGSAMQILKDKQTKALKRIEEACYHVI